MKRTAKYLVYAYIAQAVLGAAIGFVSPWIALAHSENICAVNQGGQVVILAPQTTGAATCEPSQQVYSTGNDNDNDNDNDNSN